MHWPKNEPMIFSETTSMDQKVWSRPVPIFYHLEVSTIEFQWRIQDSLARWGRGGGTKSKTFVTIIKKSGSSAHSSSFLSTLFFVLFPFMFWLGKHASSYPLDWPLSLSSSHLHAEKGEPMLLLNILITGWKWYKSSKSSVIHLI